MNASLPPIEATVLVAAVEGLPARLRKKLDDAGPRFAGLAVGRDGERYTVAVDDATTVTLLAPGGVVRSAGDVTCTCLLAPNCLHRAGILSNAPVASPDEPAPSQDTPAASEDTPAASDGAAVASDEARASTVDGASPVEAGGGADELGVVPRAAVEQVWRAAVAVLGGGVGGSGTVARAALLRAAHEAQATKVYRAAAAARVVATLLQAARGGDAHYRLADLTEAMRELLYVTHALRTGASTELGTARRQYHVEGSLRLYGLCTTAVLAGTGHAGVVTYAADRQGRLWMIADVMPGDAKRAARGGDATIAMGETALTHRGLTRAGLVVTGATAAGSRQLGAGRSVRAVTASGAGWHEEPLAGLWAEPVAEQVHRAFAALAVPVADRTAGADLLFLRVTVRGTDGDAVLAEHADGTPLTLRVAADHAALGYRENLRVLGRAEGLRMLMVARPDPGRPGTVLPLAVAPDDGEPWRVEGHADLAFDRLHASQLPRMELREEEPAPAAGPDPETAAEEVWRPAVHDPALQLLAAQVERTVNGGRVMLTFPTGRAPSAATRLRRARLETGAALLDHLVAAANDRPRNAFGRLADDDGTAFAQAWLATATYADAASRALAEASWLPAAPP
ncbi:hypothetical protein [Dactylosporangium sp. NPDC049140]|uniref:hypothetical protein n=1 Tax=Dactylosporangium sp. NPDC049140 TaxID=3155647 RepID=UPI0033C5FDAF